MLAAISGRTQAEKLWLMLAIATFPQDSMGYILSYTAGKADMVYAEEQFTLKISFAVPPWALLVPSTWEWARNWSAWVGSKSEFYKAQIITPS